MIRSKFALVALACGALTLAGCSSDSSSSDATAAPASAAVTGSDTTPAAVGGDGCDSDVVAAVTKAVTSADVTKIEVIGGCSLVNISTSLGDDGVTAALDICDAAATVAYTGNVNGVSVLSSSNKEIALGVKGAPCIGEP